jgi:hypothetical protein
MPSNDIENALRVCLTEYNRFKQITEPSTGQQMALWWFSSNEDRIKFKEAQEQARKNLRNVLDAVSLAFPHLTKEIQ